MRSYAIEYSNRKKELEGDAGISREVCTKPACA